MLTSAREQRFHNLLAWRGMHHTLLIPMYSQGIFFLLMSKDMWITLKAMLPIMDSIHMTYQMVTGHT